MSQVIPTRSQADQDARVRLWQFSLETLLLVTTLIGVLLGITLVLPALGAILILLSAGALFRTRAACRLKLANADPMRGTEKIACFFKSLGWIFTALCAGVMAFITMLVAGGIVIGSIVAMADALGPTSNATQMLAGSASLLLTVFASIMALYVVVYILKTTRPL